MTLDMLTSWVWGAAAVAVGATVAVVVPAVAIFLAPRPTSAALEPAG